MSAPSAARGMWNSRFGFILAAAGSAIGLGNIWRFPYTAGQYGGAAFVLLYLAFVFAIGIPVLLAELSLGRHSQRNPVGAFKAIVPDSWWPAVGGLGVLTGFGILSFYSVIAGWTAGYTWMSATGKFQPGLTGEESAQIFGGFVSNPTIAVGLSAAFLLVTALVVRKGISGGIEKTTTILMPILLVFLVVLAVRAVTLEGAGDGLRFLFAPDFSKLTGDAVMSALGQALFSLSIGMGAMITYGSYLPKEENIPFAGTSVALFDTGIAILGGLIIFPTLFHAGADPASGPGLVFVVMPSVFETLPLGNLFATVFYALLSIAALTSTISLLEVIAAYFVDEKGWSRNKAVWIPSLVCFAIAIPSALSQGAVESLSSGMDIAGQADFLSVANVVFGNWFLSIGAVFICLFVGWKWGVENALAEIEAHGGRLPARQVWSLAVRFVCPLAITVVTIYAIRTGNYL